MRGGTLRHFITIYRPPNPDETTQNTFGEDIETPPIVVGTFSCLVSPLQGGEIEKDMQRWGKSLYSVLLRRQPGISFTTKMYCIWNSRKLEILSVLDPGDGVTSVTFYARDFVS